MSSYMDSQIQAMYDKQEFEYYNIQETISDLSEECYQLGRALKDVLQKVQDTHPELVLKYGPMIDNENQET